MSLRVLYIAYPLLAVSDESCGGAEQVLSTLERQMAARGHRTVVAAAEPSRVAGELFATGHAAAGLDQFAQRNAEHNRRILQLLAHDCEFDLVHDMSGTFWPCAGELPLPVLATLHLSPSLYSSEMFQDFPLNLYFNCVSPSQAKFFAHLPRLLGVVENGIELSRFPCRDAACVAKPDSSYLLWLGRICEEKGPHLALDVAAAAGIEIVVAGQVYPFSYHRAYFVREIVPRLDHSARARLVEAPGFDQKIALLTGARAVLIPSLIDETSSLVAMEAMACGTPVLAFRRGALPEVVADGITGFVVDTAEEMVSAIYRLGQIDPPACRERVERLYSHVRMAGDYESIYAQVLAAARGHRELIAA